MQPVSLWCAAAGRPAAAVLGFEPDHDPAGLVVHAGALLPLLPDGPRRLEVSVGGPPSEGWPRAAFVEREPGWFVAGPEWVDLVRSQAAFGRLALHLILNDAAAGVAEVDVPIEERWRRLYEALVADLKSDAESEAALKGATGLGRARLSLWRARTSAEVMLKILGRVSEGLDRVAEEPDRRPTDAGGRTPHVRGGARAVMALPQAFRTGAIGLTSDGRPTPLLFPARDDDSDYDTAANRAARFVVERLVRAALDRAAVEEDAAASARESAPGVAAFGDGRRSRRSARHAENLREAARGLRDRLRRDEFLRAATRTSRAAFPHPLPAASGYRVLREALADDLALRKGALDDARLRALFADAAHEAPALTELYERWVGVSLIRTLKALGFAPERGDVGYPAPGGAPAAFSSPSKGRVRLHVVPAFRKDRSPVAGVELRPAAGDPRTLVTPDFVLERCDRGDVRVARPLLVLDATLSSAPDVHRKKALYAKRLGSTAKRFRLGFLRKLDAVACAAAVYPGRGRHFESDDAELRAGALPLAPGDEPQRRLLAELVESFVDGAFD